MIQFEHNMAENFAHRSARPSLLWQGNCMELEGLAKTREEAFTDYLSARHHLSLRSKPDSPGYAVALETFEAARSRLRASQRTWECHVAAHHMG